MARRYHINPDTGRPNICHAKTPERCIYAKDGQIPEHYDTKNDALKAYVESMNDKIVGTYSSRDAADNARLDSLYAFRNLTRGGLWYNSFSREDGKDLLRAADDNDTQAFDGSFFMFIKENLKGREPKTTPASQGLARCLYVNSTGDM